MKLFLLYGNEDGGYDTYDAVVVAAEDMETARTIHPETNRNNEIIYWNGKQWFNGDTDEQDYYANLWLDHPDKVKVKYLGEAYCDIKQRVILASFNAG